MLESVTRREPSTANPSLANSGLLRGPVAGVYRDEPLTSRENGITPTRTAEDTEPLSDKPWVSVVIPNYNRVETLKEAIESVLTQDYPYIECIVVDAASTDGTIELLKSYGDKITWISRPDRGAFDAINDGWKMSKGEILAWVNSDDIWDKGAATYAVRYFKDMPDVDVLYGTCGAIDEAGRLIDEYPARPWDLHFALENCDHIINQTASFMRRRIIEKVDYLYPAWCHDHDLWLRIAAAGGTFGTTQRRLGSARVWGDNLGNNPKVIIPGKVGLTKRFFDAPNLPAHIRKLRRRAISNSYLRCMFYISPTKPSNWLIGAQVMAQAVIADPTNIFYLGNQVGTMLLRRTPIPAVSHLVTSLVGGVARRIGGLLNFLVVKPVVIAVEATESVLHALRVRTILGAVAPIAAVSAAGAIVYDADLPLNESASAFFFLSLPLLVMVLLYMAPWKRD